MKKEKQVQIPESLFCMMARYFLLDIDTDYVAIKKGLEEKVEAVAMRQLYSTYKTAPTDEQKEEARQKYLDAKGVPTSFRW